MIELDFKPTYPVGKHIPVATWGSLFRHTVSIRDDKGKDHAIESYGYCGPHNPRNESKSAGEEQLLTTTSSPTAYPSAALQGKPQLKWNVIPNASQNFFFVRLS